MPAFEPCGRLGLVLHPQRDPAPVVEKLTSWARSQGKRLMVDAREGARVPGDVEPVSTLELVEQADALLSLGGDGTMLGALRLAAQRPVPVLGVNLGDRGFLVEVQPEELDAALDRLGRGDYTVEGHSAVLVRDGLRDALEDDGQPTAAVGMGVHPFRDPKLTDEFDAPRLALDVREPHVYAAEWRPSRVDFLVDGRHVKSVNQAPDYAMQMMIAVFSFPAKDGPADHVPELAVDFVRGSESTG